VTQPSTPQWLVDALAEFGIACKEKLAGPGDREAAIRTPLEELLGRFGEKLGLKAVFHDEVRDEERRVRPDYGVSIDGAISGYVEVKAPGRAIDPTGFKGHDLEQWKRQRDLPNLFYTNGTEWRLFRDGEPVGEPVHLTGGSLAKVGRKLTGSAEFEELLTDFLRWEPAPIGSVTTLVRAIAPLTRLLRSEVLDQLASERKAVAAGAPEYKQPFLGLAADWRALLFPTASDEVFADGYAQTVTFALLLARSDGIELDGSTLHTVGDELGDHHSLMGRALQLLTDTVAADFKVTLDLLVRVIGAVDWPAVRAGKRDTYLHLYEHFLEKYDPELRKQSGSYYTPIEVVEQMVRLTDEVLKTRLGRTGFSDEKVLTVDPAMGTGTFLQAVIDRAAEQITEMHGPGMVRGLVTDLAKRLVGFELQTGPFAVAELRTTDTLRRTGATPPPGGMRLYVTDTLDDPNAEIEQLASGLGAISDSRRQANIVKRDTPVTVVIGNPPYRERAEGLGGWVEMGSEGARKRGKKAKGAILDDFRAEGNGLSEYVLKNLYVYFWRWATWKVFDAIPDDRAGVVCFITTSGYISGPGFKGMREYLRRVCSEGWVINVSPEGMRPNVPTRLFPGVQQPLAIGIFVRKTDTEENTPAPIHYTMVEGRRTEKHKTLTKLGIKGNEWREARSKLQAPFTPAADSNWDEYPALVDMLPWAAPGVKPNRTWVYAPLPNILSERWNALVAETDIKTKRILFKETSDTSLEAVKTPLPNTPARSADRPFKNESGKPPNPIRIGFRSFDRQWLIPDSRLIHRPSPDLWSAASADQLFVIELHSKPISNGPGVSFSALIPDMHFFKGSEGGRVLPMLYPDGSTNVASGLLDGLSEVLGIDLSASELIAYVGAVVSHSLFTEHFADELTTPGIRVPITEDLDIWKKGVELGKKLIWLHTYGKMFADKNQDRPLGDIRLPKNDPRQPLSLKPITKMPEVMSYDGSSQILRLGDGEWGPVIPAVVDFAMDGRKVLDSWFNYRKKVPGGKRTSPLDDIHVESWPAEWTIELIDLLTVLTRLVELEPAQADLLDRILAGPIATKDDLAARGVKWPTTKKDHSPRRAGLGGGTAHQPTLGDAAD
jgi:Type ISP C-terminal specificity domain/N-6 DNA Methylase